MKKLVLIFALILAVVYFVSINKNHLKVEYISIGTQPTKALEIASFDATAKPKNIILIIGDGTGLNQITLSRIATGGADHRLAIDQMPFFGHSLTLFIQTQLLQQLPGLPALKQKINFFQ